MREGRRLEETGWADAAGRASANGSAPGRPEAPPRAAADQPEQDEGDPRRRRGEHKNRQNGDNGESHDHRNQETGAEHGGPHNRIGPPTRPRRAHPAIGWKVHDQLRKVAVAPGTQRPLYPLLELVGLEPALAGRLAQPVDDRLAIGIRRPQRIVASHRSPERYRVAVGPGRSELFGNSADDYLKVHDTGTSEADVTEGSGGVWERLHYDWHDPNRVVMTTTDSNVWGGRSGHTYTLTRNPTARPTSTPS
jgi:hypothetical protein